MALDSHKKEGKLEQTLEEDEDSCYICLKDALLHSRPSLPTTPRAAAASTSTVKLIFVAGEMQFADIIAGGQPNGRPLAGRLSRQRLGMNNFHARVIYYN